MSAVVLAAATGAAVWWATGPGPRQLARTGPAASQTAATGQAGAPGTQGATAGESAAEPGEPSPKLTVTPPAPPGNFPPPADQARRELAGLAVAKNQGSSSYQRSAFGPGWGGYGYYPKLPGGCEARDYVLRRDLSGVKAGDRNVCIVFSGVLHDPYTGKELSYSRYKPSDIQIDHVVALGAAWRTGASDWTAGRRIEFANDPNNMLAVDGQANNDKGSKTPDQWRPPHDVWCAYAERWVGIKSLYLLTITAAEKAALEEMLAVCAE